MPNMEMFYTSNRAVQLVTSHGGNHVGKKQLDMEHDIVPTSWYLFQLATASVPCIKSNEVTDL
jgi:hypothetical protein